MKEMISQWYRWGERNKYKGIKFPGVYFIAISDDDLSGSEFAHTCKIVYIGMTNSIRGLQGRLDQFDNTIQMKGYLHGGADRFLYKHNDYRKILPKIYVALVHWECEPKNETSADLRLMGDVVKAEYEFMAMHVDLYNKLPEFNRKKDSPKWSLKTRHIV